MYFIKRCICNQKVKLELDIQEYEWLQNIDPLKDGSTSKVYLLKKQISFDDGYWDLNLLA